MTPSQRRHFKGFALTASADPHAKVELAEAWLCRVPLTEPVHLATRLVRSRDWLIVRLTTAGGHWGLGFCYAGYEAGELAIAALKHLLLPALVGSDVSEPAAVWNSLYKRALLHGRAGIVQRCLSAIDIAMWDRNARAICMSLAQHVAPAGVLRKTLPGTYAGAGYYEAGGDETEAESLRRVIKATGTTAIKVKAGKFQERREAQRLQAFRRAIGDDVLMCIDANGVYSSAGQAFSAMNTFHDVAKISMIEDPFAPDDLRLYGDLRRQIRAAGGGLPVATGELFTNENEFVLYGEAGLADVLEVDATCCGGITAFRRILAHPSLKHIPIETHWFPELHLPLSEAFDRVARVEVFADASIINFGTLVSKEQTSSPQGLGYCPEFGAVLGTLVEKAELSSRRN